MGNTNTTAATGRDGENLIDLPEDLVAGLEDNMNASTSRMRPKLGFHNVHGEHVRISKGGKMAKRVESFCKGLAFSDRPIEIDEIVCLKFAEMATNWSGVLRFGVTNTDPATLAHSLPRFACPDLTSKEGNWAKALAERYCQTNSILHFYVRENGELYYGINGVQKGLFLSGINTRSPIYVMVDIYGNSNCLEFLDPADVPPLRRHPRFLGVGGSKKSPVPPPVSAQSSSSNSDSSENHARPLAEPTSSSPNIHSSDESASVQLARELNQRLNLGPQPAAPAPVPGLSTAAVPSGASRTASVPANTARFYAGVPFDAIYLHAVHGKNVILSQDRTVAHRLETEYTHGYVFTNRPIRLNEKVVVQIANTMPEYQGGLAFGMTSCDPIHLRADQLPEDADLLLDRGEYWVVAKDIASSPKNQEELGFHINDEGQVHFARNNASSRVIMHVDQTQKMWMFFDVYGSTQKINILGSTSVGTLGHSSNRAELPPRRQTLPNSTSAGLLDSAVGGAGGAVPLQPLRVNLPAAPTAAQRPRPPLPPPRPPALSRPMSVAGPSTAPRSAAAPDQRKSSAAAVLQPAAADSEEGECSVCMCEQVNAVIYTCGHMSMCYSCAIMTWEKKGDCPICRTPIKDVIKAFRT